jgi:oligoendopeptidase F
MNAAPSETSDVLVTCDSSGSSEYPGDGSVENAVWDLRPLLSESAKATSSSALHADWPPTMSVATRAALVLEEAGRRAAALSVWRNRIASMSASEMASVMTEVGAIADLLGRVGSVAFLDQSTSSDDPAKGALVAQVTEQATAVENQMRFIDLEWSVAPEAFAEALLSDPQLAFCERSLRVTRLAASHRLSEAEESVLADKQVTGSAAWTRLYDEQMAAVTVDLGDGPVSYEYVFPSLMSADAEIRKHAAETFTAALAPGLRTRAFIYNTLMADKATDDRLRAYPTWVSSRNLGNQASDASVDALVTAVSERFEIARRWYRVKARLLGQPRLNDYDRMAPVGLVSTERIEWSDAKAQVIDAFQSFSPTLAEQADGFFAGRIHAPMVPGKRGGAYCSPNVPSTPAHVFVNYTGTRNDVLTLAHELGHGVHFEMARRQGIFHHTTPLTVAETASVFGEEVTFGRMLNDVSEPSARLSLLADHVEGHIATVFRQVAMFKFEASAHMYRRSSGELSVDTLNELWSTSQADLLGDTVDISEGYRSWWSYVPHFIHTPGYVYAYAFGQLLALSVYQRYLNEGPSFVPKYEKMLSLGGSVSPEELGKVVDCDLTDPTFWDAGLDLVERAVVEAESAAEAHLHR